MKFLNLISVVISVGAVLGHGNEEHSADNSGSYKSTIKFDESLIAKKFEYTTTNFDKVLTLKDLTEKHAAFFKENPSVKASVNKCFTDHPNFKQVFLKATSAIIRQVALKKYKVTPRDLTTIVVDYTAANPDFLKAVQHLGIEVMKENPNLVDDFFNVVENVVRKNPTYFLDIKKRLVEFSHGQSENSYKKLFKMVLDSASINPDFASHLLVHITQVDLIACQSGDHNNMNQNDGNQNQNQYSATVNLGSNDGSQTINNEVRDSINQIDATIGQGRDERDIGTNQNGNGFLSNQISYSVGDDHDQQGHQDSYSRPN